MLSGHSLRFEGRPDGQSSSDSRQDWREKKSNSVFGSTLWGSVRLWVKDIKREILEEEKEVYKLNVSKDPILMKEATDMLVETLSPRQLGNEVHTYAPELLADISSELNDHYDNQAKKHISTNLFAHYFHLFCI